MTKSLAQIEREFERKRIKSLRESLSEEKRINEVRNLQRQEYLKRVAHYESACGNPNGNDYIHNYADDYFV